MRSIIAPNTPEVLCIICIADDIENSKEPPLIIVH